MEKEDEKDYHEGHEPQFGYDHFNEEEEEEVKKGISKYVEDMEKRYDPAHPYCTNWPVGHRKKEI